MDMKKVFVFSQTFVHSVASLLTVTVCLQIIDGVNTSNVRPMAEVDERMASDQ